VVGPFDLAPLILAVSLFSSEIVLLTPENKRGGRDFEVGGIGKWLRGLGENRFEIGVIGFCSLPG
jgi:hypothetical protein